MKKLLVLMVCLLSCEEKTVEQKRIESIQCFWYQQYCFCTYNPCYGDGRCVSWTQVPDKLCEGRPK